MNDGKKEKEIPITTRIQNKLAIGPVIRRVQAELLKKVEEFRPELVFFYSQRIILPKTVEKIKAFGATIFMYNNDNPFAEYYPRYFWRNYRNALKYADVGFIYRQENRVDYEKVGCKKVVLLRSYYMADRNFYMEDPKEKVPQVVFIGHNENDSRKASIRRLLDARIAVGVPKLNWIDFENDNPYLIKLENCMEKYNEQMNASDIAIVFLSTLNHDTYTRRCFEIPATKTFMLSQYTDDIASMFEEDKEIVFFRNDDELVSKVKFYLMNPKERNAIAQAGYERLMRDGHEVSDRVKQVMALYSDIKQNKRMIDE